MQQHPSGRRMAQHRACMKQPRMGGRPKGPGCLQQRRLMTPVAKRRRRQATTTEAPHTTRLCSNGTRGVLERRMGSRAGSRVQSYCVHSLLWPMLYSRMYTVHTARPSRDPLLPRMRECPAPACRYISMYVHLEFDPAAWAGRGGADALPNGLLAWTVALH